MAGKLRDWTARLLLAGVTLALCLAAVEVTCRWLEVDFRKAQFGRVPIYYRAPQIPTGEAFLRRDGPAVWRGRIRATTLRLLGQLPDAYADEPCVSVHYDGQGFRNEPPLDAWDVVVAGDAFTELGYLPYADLFTTRLGALLGVRVKNLGVGYTGTLTHAHYLREYGCHPDARHAVLAFHEGNDVQDISSEREALREARTSGLRPARPPIQSSFLRALWRLPRQLASGFRRGSEPPRADALFLAGDRAIPVAFGPLPSAGLSEAERASLREALADFASAASACGMTPWLLYVPTKRRVLHGHLRFLESAEPALRDWQPDDLPARVAALCAELGIRFVDPMPALAAATAAGTLSYSHVFDTHFSREGSHIVGDVLADALREALRPAPAALPGQAAKDRKKQP